MLPGVEELTTSELRDVAGQAVIIVDPDGAENRHQEAAARRELRMQPRPDGMATLKAHLPADGAVKIFQVSDLLATGTAGTPGDSRGIGARRVDALVDIADHLLTHGFVDLTDYLGEQLPDHGTPTPRARRTSTDTTNDRHRPPPTRPPPTAPAMVPTRPAPTLRRRPRPSPVTPLIRPAPPPTTPERERLDRRRCRADRRHRGCDQYRHRPTRERQCHGDDAAAEVPDHADAPATERRRCGSTGSDRTPPPLPALPQRVRAPSAAGTGCSPGRAAARTCPSPSGSSTLAGLDNLPGSLAGFGAIPAGLARSIAASAATINALITDPDTGRVTAAGALTYRPTQELRDQIAAILNVCQFPSCRQPVWRCDMDHREEFNHHHPEQGGKTDPENTVRFADGTISSSTHSDWRIRIDPNRYVLEFTSPTGHTYRKQGRQAAAPGLWVSTAATAIAERLDNIANPPSTLVHRADDEPTPTSHIEDLLATILIRHHLNTKTIEIDYHPETAWETVDQDDPPPF